MTKLCKTVIRPAVRLTACLSLLLLLLLPTACEHRPLVDLQESHYIRIYLDEEMLNLTCGFYDETRLRPAWTPPAVMRVMLCDPVTGLPVTERYFQTLRQDERGHYFDGYLNASPGTYHLMAYNFGTEATLIHDENVFHTATAYTNPIATHLYNQLPSVRLLPEPPVVVYEPDPLLVAVREEIRIAAVTGADTLRTATGDHFTATSIVQGYYLQVGIKGIEYVSSAVSLLTGMAPASLVCNGEMLADREAMLYFDMNPLAPGEEEDGEGRALIYTTFTTFGKLPELDGHLSITFEFFTVDGRTQTETMDITPLFFTEEALQHRWIIIDREIEIEPPPVEGGGFSPGVDEWKEEEKDIVI